MLNKRVEEAINAQINAEMWSAYLYLSMSAWFHANGNPGFAKWYEVQFKEEQDHAMILFKYITSRGGVVKLEKIDTVPTEWESTLNVVEETLKHEQKVTSHSTKWHSRRTTLPPRACSSGLSTSKWKKRRTPRLSSTTSR